MREKSPLVVGTGYFAFFSLLMAGAQAALSPSPAAPLEFVPGHQESMTAALRDRLRAARELKAMDAAAQAGARESARKLASAAQLVVAAIPAERGLPDKFLRLLEKIAYAQPIAKAALPLRVTVDYGRTEPRGTYADGEVSVAAIDDASEMAKVLVHEIGHRIDVATFAAGPKGDLSDAFYGISWEGDAVKRKGASAADFVSGYAQTNKYEDFAESFTAYVFHNRDFARKAQKSKPLAAKYEFLRANVFPDGDFQGTAFQKDPLPDYVWDMTKPPVDLAKYLKYAPR